MIFLKLVTNVLFYQLILNFCFNFLNRNSLNNCLLVRNSLVLSDMLYLIIIKLLFQDRNPNFLCNLLSLEIDNFFFIRDILKPWEAFWRFMMVKHILIRLSMVYTIWVVATYSSLTILIYEIMLLKVMRMRLIWIIWSKCFCTITILFAVMIVLSI